MKKQSLTAKQFRIILLAILATSLAILIGGSIYAQSLLRSYSNAISTQNSTAAKSETDIATLRRIQTYLNNNTEAESAAQRVVAESSTYEYQDQIINDLSTIAAQSKISITSYTFSESSSTGTGATATPSTSGTPATPAPAGLNTKSVNIQIVSPLDYKQLLGFIKRIEQNTTKMQITSVAMSKDGTNPNGVTSNAFEIKVYVR